MFQDALLPAPGPVFTQSFFLLSGRYWIFRLVWLWSAWPVSSCSPGAHDAHWMQPRQPLAEAVQSDAGDRLRNNAASELPSRETP